MKRLDQKEFLAAYDQYADAIFRFCYAQTGDRERAKDITQDTFVRTWKYVAAGKKIDELRPFLYRTARNMSIDQHRSQRTESLEQLMESGFDVADREVNPLASAEVSRAVRLIGTLQPLYREALLLRYIDELPPREIATIVGENENVVSVRIHRGMEQLRKLMDVSS